MRTHIVSMITAATMALGAGQALAAASAEISKDEVLQAQQAWGEALVAISQAYEQGGHELAEQKARQVLDAAYGYGDGKVLFKPTLAGGEQTFRTQYDSALAYFVGGNPAYPADSGFALKGWQSVEVSNAGVLINGNLALTMGQVTLTNAAGEETTVDKTWGFQRDEEGALRIVLHHSSLPFSS